MNMPSYDTLSSVKKVVTISTELLSILSIISSDLKR